MDILRPERAKPSHRRWGQRPRQETEGKCVYLDTPRPARDCPPMSKKPQQVYTLLGEVGRSAGDGLPDGATGAALMCYASGVDEGEAVREAVAILKQADLSPLDVSGYGSLDDRLAEGHDIDEDERALMRRALDENSVIVAQMTPFFDKD